MKQQPGKHVVLTGPDGSNPLGFLCALGILRVLDEREPELDARLSWESGIRWQPVLHGLSGQNELVKLIQDDVDEWKDRFSEIEPAEGAEDVRVPPDVYRCFTSRLASASVFKGLRGRRGADYAAALASEAITDSKSKGRTRPTAFYFMAGNQRFLKTLRKVLESTSERSIREALFGPWLLDTKCATLRWQGNLARHHALLHFDPEGEDVLCCPAADFLAFRALAFFPCMPGRGRLLTTCFSRHEAANVLTWPLWLEPLGSRVVASLLAEAAHQARALGSQEKRRVGGIYSSTVIRTGQGYGSFSPARLV